MGWFSKNKDISLSSFIDLHLIEIFHTIRKLIMEVWSNYRADDAFELEKNDEDLNYAVVAVRAKLLCIVPCIVNASDLIQNACIIQ